LIAFLVCKWQQEYLKFEMSSQWFVNSLMVGTVHALFLRNKNISFFRVQLEWESLVWPTSYWVETKILMELDSLMDALKQVFINM